MIMAKTVRSRHCNRHAFSTLQRFEYAQVERGWLTTDGSDPPHSVSLIYGWGET
jgi:hypothetical protein